MALEQNEISSKSRLITLILSFLLVHRFYVGKIVSGIIFLFTIGGFGIWWLIDIIQIISGSFKDQYGKFVNNWEADKKQLTMAGGALAVVVLLGAIGGKGEKGTTSASLTEAVNTSSPSSTSSSEENKVDVNKIGDVLKFDDVEVTVTKMEQRGRVGGEYLNEAASEGATLICLQYKYKNISTTPLSSFKQPHLKLYDENGTEYEKDSGKSIYYTTDIGTDTKVMSKLNPGITVKNGEVFEISKDSWTKGAWTLKVEYGYKDYKIKLK